MFTEPGYLPVEGGVPSVARSQKESLGILAHNSLSSYARTSAQSSLQLSPFSAHTAPA
jgi:hypothetical protein